jgi:hypothetical protein
MRSYIMKGRRNVMRSVVTVFVSMCTTVNIYSLFFFVTLNKFSSSAARWQHIYKFILSLLVCPSSLLVVMSLEPIKTVF